MKRDLNHLKETMAAVEIAAARQRQLDDDTVAVAGEDATVP